jgi:hypothetical protein
LPIPSPPLRGRNFRGINLFSRVEFGSQSESNLQASRNANGGNQSLRDEGNKSKWPPAIKMAACTKPLDFFVVANTVKAQDKNSK